MSLMGMAKHVTVSLTLSELSGGLSFMLQLPYSGQKCESVWFGCSSPPPSPTTKLEMGEILTPLYTQSFKWAMPQTNVSYRDCDRLETWFIHIAGELCSCLINVTIRKWERSSNAGIGLVWKHTFSQTHIFPFQPTICDQNAHILTNEAYLLCLSEWSGDCCADH